MSVIAIVSAYGALSTMRPEILTSTTLASTTVESVAPLPEATISPLVGSSHRLAKRIREKAGYSGGTVDADGSPGLRRPFIVGETYPGRNPTEGRAELRAGPERHTYAAGALLANGARIAEIHDDHVLLERDGQTAKLYSRRSRRSMRQHPDEVLAAGGEEDIPGVATATSTETLTAYFRPSPEFRDDQLIGYRVYPGTDTAAFKQFGLEPGDVLTALDGVTVSGINQVTEAFRQIVSGAAIVATVERQGKIQLLTFDGAQLQTARDRMKT